MKPVLRLLAFAALAVPAFADSITFYASHTGGLPVSGQATMGLWEHSTGNSALSTADGGGGISNRGAFAFEVTGWTGASTNNMADAIVAGPSGYRSGSTLSGVRSQRLIMMSGGNSNGRLYTNGHGRGSENSRITVPEPETLGLLGTGLFFIGGLVRRRMRMRELLHSADHL